MVANDCSAAERPTGKTSSLRRGLTGNGMSVLKSQSVPTDKPSPIRPHLPILPEHFYPLGPNTQTYGSINGHSHSNHHGGKDGPENGGSTVSHPALGCSDSSCWKLIEQLRPLHFPVESALCLGISEQLCHFSHLSRIQEAAQKDQGVQVPVRGTLVLALPLKACLHWV
jgi:hypothetical protein